MSKEIITGAELEALETIVKDALQDPWVRLDLSHIAVSGRSNTAITRGDVFRLVAEVRRLREQIATMQSDWDAEDEEIERKLAEKYAEGMQLNQDAMDLADDLDHERKRAEAWKVAAEMMDSEFNPTKLCDSDEMVEALEAARKLEETNNQ